MKMRMAQPPDICEAVSDLVHNSLGKEKGCKQQNEILPFPEEGNLIWTDLCPPEKSVLESGGLCARTTLQSLLE
jgi:hypothetical protein